MPRRVNHPSGLVLVASVPFLLPNTALAGPCEDERGDAERTALIRDLRSESSPSRVTVVAQGNQVELCVSTPHCAWKAAPAHKDSLLGFAPYAIGQEHCQSTYDQHRMVDRIEFSNCAMPDALSKALGVADMLVDHAGLGEACGTSAAFVKDRAFLVAVDNTPVFVASVSSEASDLCVVVGAELDGSYRALASLIRKCPGNIEDAMELANQWLGNASPASGSYVVGASFAGGGFGFSTSDPNFELPNAAALSWGENTHGAYLTAWLEATRDAAVRSSSSGSPLADRPLVSGDDSPVGRVLRWLAAGLFRVNARTFDENDPNWVDSAVARDWMTRTYLLSPNDFQGTMLRAEKVRTNWGRK